MIRIPQPFWPDPDSRFIIPVPELFGLVGSGSETMAGSDMYNLLTTLCEDQASNAIRIPQPIWPDPDSRLIIPVPDPWPEPTCIIYYLPYVKTRQATRFGFRNLLGLVGSGF
jgi:hypothetical protein